MTPRLALALAVLLPGAASGGWDCETDYHLLRGITEIRRVAEGVELTVLGRTPGGRCDSVLYDASADTWTRRADNACLALRQEPRCDAQVPNPGVTIRRVLALRPELDAHRQSWIEFSGRDFDLDHVPGGVGACASHGDDVWFALAFYSGEGEFGVGGVGRVRESGGEAELRHPAPLRPYSVYRMAHDGDSLWLGTIGSYEVGLHPALGLARYDWDADLFETFGDSLDRGPCGNFVNDLRFEDGVLWVATDLGLSRWRKDTGDWTHTDPAGLHPEQALRCEQLVEEKLARALGEPGSQICNHDAVLIGYLRELTAHLRAAAGPE